MEITAVCELEYYDDPENGLDHFPFSFYFNFKFDECTANVDITEPYIYTKERWEKLISAIENDTDDKLDFYQGNGEGSISCHRGFVCFTACPSGAGGDTRVSFKLPLFKYKEKLVEILNRLINDPAATIYWEKISNTRQNNTDEDAPDF